MARHLYLYEGNGYEGEVELFRRARVSAAAAESADLPGLRPSFLYRVHDRLAPAAEGALVTDDEIAVRRYVAGHPGAEVAIVPMVRAAGSATAGARRAGS